jgi:GNAT superfamily N-acetyltransferase
MTENGYSFPEPMESGDLDAGLELTRIASWNQLRDDWEAFLRLGRLRCARDPDGRIVATIGLLPLGRTLTWISLVLVRPEHRGRGLASWMMRWAVERAGEEGWRAMLDATEQGSHVYRKLGFRTTDNLYRCVLEESAEVGPEELPLASRRIGPEDCAEVAAWEHARSGLDRYGLLADWFHSGRVRGRVDRHPDGRIHGISFSRRGRRMPHLGPVHADNAGLFREQVRWHQRAYPGPILMDLTGKGLAQARDSWGDRLRVEREFLRMGLGEDLPSIPDSQYAIAGPEFA